MGHCWHTCCYCCCRVECCWIASVPWLFILMCVCVCTVSTCVTSDMHIIPTCVDVNADVETLSSFNVTDHVLVVRRTRAHPVSSPWTFRYSEDISQLLERSLTAESARRTANALSVIGQELVSGRHRDISVSPNLQFLQSGLLLHLKHSSADSWSNVGNEHVRCRNRYAAYC